MGSDRYPLLLLLATMAVQVPAASAAGTTLPSGEPPGVIAEVVEVLRASVQERLSAVGLSADGLQDSSEMRRQLAQWYNFPNFFNQNCFRGYWRNC
jgi:hypothetical protein